MRHRKRGTLTFTHRNIFQLRTTARELKPLNNKHISRRSQWHEMRVAFIAYCEYRVMKRHTPLERAMRAFANAERRIRKQELLIVRLRGRGADATHAARVLDELKGTWDLASDRLGREEAARIASLWIHLEPGLTIH